MLRDPETTRFRELCRDSETNAAYYTNRCMNGIIFVAVCLFAGFFVGEFLRLTNIGVSVLHKLFELTR